MAPPAEAPQHSYPEGAPSLLSQPYLAAHGPGQVVVGATKQYGTSAAASWEACAAGSLPWSHPEAQAAASVLLGPAAALWGPLSHWRVTHARCALVFIVVQARVVCLCVYTRVCALCCSVNGTGWVCGHCRRAQQRARCRWLGVCREWTTSGWWLAWVRGGWCIMRGWASWWRRVWCAGVTSCYHSSCGGGSDVLRVPWSNSILSPFLPTVFIAIRLQFH